MISAGRNVFFEPPTNTIISELIVCLENEKSRGRSFVALGRGGREILASWQGGPVNFDTMESLEDGVLRCRRCGLFRNRSRPVPGEGSSQARIMIVGEGPGAEEDREGRPFVGPAGQLLTKMLQAIQIDRRDVFITNRVKCRPPGNRKPEPEELSACFPYLKEQIRLIKPLILVALGAFAAQGLTGMDRSISALRGKSYFFQDILCIPTYHPAYLLRSPEFKRPAWEDLQKIRREFDRLTGSL
ncbi:MAG: uracil-DNA glycosylase [Desulfobacteraceae bacterium]|nr:MAG: uracil-DNA glycosylase [Desulfobacteraceae bacterium]